MEGHRAERITEAIREELSEIVGYEMSDPRVSGVSITDVHVSPDMRLAQVRVRAQSADANAAVKALEGAKGFLRRELAHRLQLFRTPDLRFELDTGIPDSRIQHLLRRAKRGRPRDEGSASDEQ